MSSDFGFINAANSKAQSVHAGVQSRVQSISRPGTSTGAQKSPRGSSCKSKGTPQGSAIGLGAVTMLCRSGPATCCVASLACRSDARRPCLACIILRFFLLSSCLYNTHIDLLRTRSILPYTRRRPRARPANLHSRKGVRVLAMAHRTIGECAVC